MQRILSIIFLLSTWYYCDAQMDRFRHITTSDGLPENTGQCIVQDDQGFIWIATQNGLARFDGLEFKVFQNNTSDDSTLSNNQVEYVFPDETGYFWIATRNGFNRFDPVKGTFERFIPDTSEAFHKNWFRYGIEKDANGHIWCATLFGFYEIFNWEDRQFRFYPTSNSAGTAISYDSIQNRVYGVSGDSVFYFQDGEMIFHSQSPKEIQDIYCSSRGLLAGTLSGAYVYTDGEWVKPGWLNTENEFYTSNFYEDRQGNIWILCSEGLIICDANGKTMTRTHISDDPESLSHALCISMLEDREGLYWIGTGQGVNILNPRQDQFTRLSINSGGKPSTPRSSYRSH